MKKKQLKSLRSKSDKELNDLYMQYNLVISKFRGQVHNHALEGGVSLKPFYEAKRSRAVILTILNQRRHERMWRDGRLK